MRALAVLVVLLGHAGMPHIEGSLGVTVFFFLSGFLITTLLRMEYDGARRISLRDFYLRRALRILPPLYVTLIGILIINATGLIPDSFHPGGTVASFLHFSNYWQIFVGQSSIPRGAGVFWSVAVEEHFYLVFPLLYIALRHRGVSRGRQAVVLGGICAVALVWRLILEFAIHANSLWLNDGSDARADSLLLGCLLAACANPYLDELPIRSRRALTSIVLPLCTVIVVGVEYLPHRVAYTIGYSIQGLALMPVFVAIVRYPECWAGRFLNLRPVAFVGVLSYSVYLTHRLVQVPLQEKLDWGWGATAIVSLLGAIAISWAMHELIEKPAGRLRRRLAHVAARPEESGAENAAEDAVERAMPAARVNA